MEHLLGSGKYALGMIQEAALCEGLPRRQEPPGDLKAILASPRGEHVNGGG